MRGAGHTMPMLRRLLEAVHREERRRVLLRRAGLGAGVFFLCLWVLIVVDAIRPLSVGAMWMAACVVLVVGVAAAGLLFSAWRGRTRPLTERELTALAMRIEAQVGCRDRVLSSAASLASAGETADASVALRALAVQRGEAMARRLDAAALLTVGFSRRPWRASEALAALLAGALLWQPRLPGSALARLAQPWADLPPYARTVVALSVARDEAAGPLLETDRLRVFAQAYGPTFPEAAELVAQSEDGQAARRLGMVRVEQGDDAGVFTAVLPVGRGPLRIRAEAAGGRSRWAHLQPLAVPRPVRVMAEVHGPGGWDRPVRLVELRPRGLDVWAGSTVMVHVEADAPLAGGEAVWASSGGGAAGHLALEPVGEGGRRLTTRLVVSGSGSLRITGSGRDGAAMTPAVIVPIHLLTDGPPTIMMTLDEATGLLRVTAQDSHGLEGIEVVLSGADGAVQPVGRWDFAPPGPRAYAVTLRAPGGMSAAGDMRVTVSATGQRGTTPAMSAQAFWPPTSAAATAESQGSGRGRGARGTGGEVDVGGSSGADRAWMVVDAGEPAGWVALEQAHRGSAASRHDDDMRTPRIPLQYRDAVAAYLRGLAQVMVTVDQSHAGSRGAGDEASTD